MRLLVLIALVSLSAGDKPAPSYGSGGLVDSGSRLVGGSGGVLVGGRSTGGYGGGVSGGVLVGRGRTTTGYGLGGGSSGVLLGGGSTAGYGLGGGSGSVFVGSGGSGYGLGGGAGGFFGRGGRLRGSRRFRVGGGRLGGRAGSFFSGNAGGFFTGGRRTIQGVNRVLTVGGRSSGCAEDQLPDAFGNCAPAIVQTNALVFRAPQVDAVLPPIPNIPRKKTVVYSYIDVNDQANPDPYVILPDVVENKFVVLAKNNDRRVIRVQNDEEVARPEVIFVKYGEGDEDTTIPGGVRIGDVVDVRSGYGGQQLSGYGNTQLPGYDSQPLPGYDSQPLPGYGDNSSPEGYN